MDTKSNPKFGFNILLLCLFLKSHISLAADTISADESLSGDQTIVSADGVFELGFFKPGIFSYNYVGIWYSEQVVSERTIVWVANREIPVADRFSSVLRISDGNLILFSESKTPVWSTNLASTTTSGSVQAVLLDSGNLVLRADGSSTNTSEPLWQSFDHPAHTLLPGGKLGFNIVTNRTQILTSWKSSEDPAPGLFSLQLDPNGSNAYLIFWNRSRQYWSSGAWDAKSRIFSWVPEMRRNNMYNYSYVTNKNESYYTYSLNNPKTISRLVMHTSGQIRQFTWSENSREWNLFGSQPKRQCEVYDFCGASGSCNELSTVSCNCLTGFEPKSEIEWNLRAYSSGCSRITNLQYCGTAVSTSAKYRAPDVFQEIRIMSLPENNQSVVIGNISECGSICLNSCSCTAYAYDSSTGCSIFTGDLLNLQQLGTGVNANKRSLVIALVSETAGLLTITFGYFLWKKTWGKERARRRKNGETKTLEKERKHRKKYDEILSNVGDGDGKNDTELPLFSLRSILAATNNFSEANKVGEGGFGPVYKGILPGNQEVAIKRLSKKSGQGHQEFMNELKLIAKLQHTNLVRLFGYCIEEEELILIYEFMANRSLDKFLFDPSEKLELDWGKRFRIIEGIAQGILYIHKYSRLKIIHRDLKASNVLLDGAMNPKISDFGMAKIFEINQTEANTNRVVGTYGYMSPEYARYGHFSEKLDVFSFGVLLLEIVSGKKNAAFHRFEHSLTLAGWAWELWREGRGMEVIDASVRETCRHDEALKCIQVGFLCVQEDPADRPTMSSVILMLANEATSLPPSKEPAFSTHRNSVAVSSSPQTTPIISNNAVTISLPEGR
ncbi:G-type lectin S-receptor-like serine/threonine-protein kinase At4g27290 isoform X2 [Prunus persica]|uniref:G-type lectin S-receptor-like serine/threonine-protein kinase At4g27290 isoform X2 n=1 Tax=Prunus persica TaxID=3760 RepID=UPI0009AB5CE1|nr:G-type lectin S-receptor-like serine/threonine-protein kinase At4g27290 isoform X2 [Prunus persica]